MVKKECGGDKSEERKEEEMRPIYYMSVGWGPVRDLSIHSRAKLRIQAHPQRKKNQLHHSLFGPSPATLTPPIVPDTACIALYVCNIALKAASVDVGVVWGIQRILISMCHTRDAPRSIQSTELSGLLTWSEHLGNATPSSPTSLVLVGIPIMSASNPSRPITGSC